MVGCDIAHATIWITKVNGHSTPESIPSFNHHVMSRETIRKNILHLFVIHVPCDKGGNMRSYNQQSDVILRLEQLCFQALVRETFDDNSFL
jgi:hypothetical protein